MTERDEVQLFSGTFVGDPLVPLTNNKRVRDEGQRQEAQLLPGCQKRCRKQGQQGSPRDRRELRLARVRPKQQQEAEERSAAA